MLCNGWQAQAAKSLGKGVHHCPDACRRGAHAGLVRSLVLAAATPTAHLRVTCDHLSVQQLPTRGLAKCQPGTHVHSRQLEIRSLHGVDRTPARAMADPHASACVVL